MHRVNSYSSSFTFLWFENVECLVSFWILLIVGLRVIDLSVLDDLYHGRHAWYCTESTHIADIHILKSEHLYYNLYCIVLCYAFMSH